jgi:hypothetical protein
MTDSEAIHVMDGLDPGLDPGLGEVDPGLDPGLGEVDPGLGDADAMRADPDDPPHLRREGAPGERLAAIRRYLAGRPAAPDPPIPPWVQLEEVRGELAGALVLFGVTITRLGLELALRRRLPRV